MSSRSKRRRIVVVGAGVAGLSTAYAIQMRLESKVDVTVIADQFFEETTSHGAAGISRPHYEDSREKMLGYRKWRAASLMYFSKMALTAEAPDMGISVISGFQFMDKEPKNDDLYAEFCLSFRRLTNVRECGAVSADMLTKYNHITSEHTVLVQCHRYLPWLANNIKKLGGKLVRRKIRSLQELCSMYDVIVVCCGLRSMELVADESLYPIRGIIIKVEAPWIRHYYVARTQERSSYVIPCDGYVSIGGIYQERNSSTKVDQSEKEKVWELALKHMPSLAKAKWIGDWVGLRPGRPSVRLESGSIIYDGRSIPVVYNYGHGGSGVDMSWGCALDAAKLVENFIQANHSKI